MSHHPSSEPNPPSAAASLATDVPISASTPSTAATPEAEALRRLRAELRRLSRIEAPFSLCSGERTLSAAAGAEPGAAPGDSAQSTAANAAHAQPDEGAEDAPAPAAAAPLSGVDLLPELIAYRDRGCHIAPSCLHCPLAVCIYDAGAPRAHRRRQQRDRRLRALAARGWSTEQLARHAGLSPSQIRRIRARFR